VMIASLIRDALQQMNPDFPAPTFDQELYTSDSIS
jgi:hypothetical protein